VRRALAVALIACLVSLSACGDDGGSESATDSSTTTSSTIGATPSTGVPVEAGSRTGSVTVDGVDRSYRLHVPPGLDSGSAVPLLVALHGGGGSGGQFASASGFDAVADREGFVVVYPNGTGAIPTWNAGLCCGAAARDDVDDVAFVSILIDELAADLPIDPAKVVLTGHSNGSTMSYRLACELADRIVAIGVQAAPLTFDGCSPSVPVSVLHVHGANDANVPIDGGVGSGMSGVDWPSVRDGLDLMATAAGCDAEPDEVVADGTTRTTWQGCEQATSVESIVVAAGAHAWMRPGGSGRRGDADDVGFDSTETIWAFLEARLG
jgi:polyhydroxybutyrate depolymerase